LNLFFIFNHFQLTKQQTNQIMSIENILQKLQTLNIESESLSYLSRQLDILKKDQLLKESIIFDFSSMPINIYKNQDFWCFTNFNISNKVYCLSKRTNLILESINQEYILFGLKTSHHYITIDKLDQSIISWCKNSGITINNTIKSSLVNILITQELKAQKDEQKEQQKIQKLQEKEQLKAQKLQEKEQLKAQKLQEKEQLKAQKLQEKEQLKAQKLQEKEQLKEQKLQEKEQQKLQEQINTQNQQV
jgi:hypothetical protein